MVISPVVIIVLLIVVFLIFFLAFLSKYSSQKTQEKLTKKYWKSVNSNMIKTNALNSKLLNKIGSIPNNQKKLTLLFRKAKNPWGITPTLYNAIRYGGAALGLILAALALPLFGWLWTLPFLAAGFLCWFLPKNKYETRAKERENEWNQLYQFMWVISHNASSFGPKKVFTETSNYIMNHNPQFKELIQGFDDFAMYYSDDFTHELIEKNYFCFAIPKELFQIMQTMALTGQYPEEELKSLRKIIINKQDFLVRDVLTTVAMKGTLASTPCLLVTLFLVVLTPVVQIIFQAL